LGIDYIVSAFKVSLWVIVQCDLDVVQDVIPSVVVPAMAFFAVPGVFDCVSVCIVDACSWLELVECVCEVGVGADEGCECKLHNKVED